MLNAQKIAKKIAFLQSRLLNFAIAIIPRSFDQEKKIAIAIDDQKIADHSCLG